MFTGGDRLAVEWHAACRVAITCVAIGIGSDAIADTIQITANNAASSNATSYGGFEGSLSYDELGGGMARLTISLENTSQHDGWLTAIAFDAAAGTSGWSFDWGLSSGLSTDWQDIAGTISVSPFGDRSFGASISSDWEGGGSPMAGVAAGDSATWVFQGAWTDGGVSAADFLSPNDGYNLMVRFRGFSNGDSDKLPGMAVPGLGGIAALAGVGVVRRRRR